MIEDEDSLTPEDSLALIERQRAEAARRTDVDVRLLYGPWGVAWLAGFGLLWLVSTGRVGLPPQVAVLVLVLLLGAAAVVTALSTARAVAGIGGPRTLASTLFAYSWLLAFTCVGLLLGAFGRAGASPELMTLMSSTVVVAAVGLLYCAGGAVWRDPQQFRLGAWLLAVDVVGAYAGLPHLYLLLALAGGGGFLVAAVRFRPGRVA